MRERVLDALAGYSGDLRWINVDFTEGGAQVSIHHHPVSVVQELCDLLGVLDDAPRVREVITPRGDYQVWGYAPDASLRGGISVTWFPDPPAGSPPAD